jgi:hypothetical protein
MKIASRASLRSHFAHFFLSFEGKLYSLAIMSERSSLSTMKRFMPSISTPEHSLQFSVRHLPQAHAPDHRPWW